MNIQIALIAAFAILGVRIVTKKQGIPTPKWTFPLYGCAICMSPYWGLAFYSILSPVFDWKWAIVQVLATMGIVEVVEIIYLANKKKLELYTLLYDEGVIEQVFEKHMNHGKDNTAEYRDEG